jgi:hypothetical protein
MVTTVSADISPLLECIASGDEDGMIHETLSLLKKRVPPARLAARVGIPAAWGGGDGYPLTTLSVGGRVAEWMRGVPAGPEPAADERRVFLPALPLVQGFVAVSDRLKKGLLEPHPAQPEPLIPRDVRHPDGPLGVLREAVASHDARSAESILLGYYATGTDYRQLLAAIFAALDLRYPEGGRPLSFGVAGSRVLDMAEWGDRLPAFIYWFAPLMVDAAPATAAEAAARAYAQAEGHGLGWLRTRLGIPREEAAGTEFQRALRAGSPEAACEATLQALRRGATPMGVAAGISLSAAEVVNNVPTGDRVGLRRAAELLLYTHSVHLATTVTQNQEIWPLLYTAASAVNATRPDDSAETSATAPRGARATQSTPVGGLIPASMLRTLEQQVRTGDTEGALSIAYRYLQMGHPSRALAGIIGNVAASRDKPAGEPETFHPLVLTAAAIEEYMMVPTALASGGQNALLTAAIRLAGELDSGRHLAEKVQSAIDAQVSAGNSGSS